MYFEVGKNFDLDASTCGNSDQALTSDSSFGVANLSYNCTQVTTHKEISLVNDPRIITYITNSYLLCIYVS